MSFWTFSILFGHRVGGGGGGGASTWIILSAHSEFFFGGGGVASRVPWGWRDNYGKAEILAGWVTKICLKCTKKLG